MQELCKVCRRLSVYRVGAGESESFSTGTGGSRIMKILNIEFNAFGSADIKEAFLAEGHTYVDFFL